ncbi:ubiquitin domain-containing protein 2-like [Myxocyprinus asiaticus]|uniref:ubiquitin domain-containing protein 2-like n=1 Tax=Myxocyprinus asiaticus TaxID=70543 RepID=UPI0022233ACC|nr:ubiquitin domain-containing protein 2-like [Myxocyprinus asiaticus]
MTLCILFGPYWHFPRQLNVVYVGSSLGFKTPPLSVNKYTLSASLQLMPAPCQSLSQQRENERTNERTNEPERVCGGKRRSVKTSMGGCVGSHRDSSGSLNENSDGTGVALGRNQPLKREKPKWKSDYPMTDGQLRSKRDEFWDTAPAFEGRKEIWDALKAAAQAFESNDHELAQAIIDGASITLPHGALTECYDELGNRYQLPVYCLSPPVNMIEEKSELETIEVPEAPVSEGQECQLRLRLSTGQDLRLAVRTSDNVQQMKRRLQGQEGVAASTQRWFFSGRPLTDKMKLEDLKISRDYVVQVIVSQPPTNPPLPQNPTPVEN